MFQNGYWVVGRLRGATIRLHWSILLSALVLSRFHWSPGFFLAYPCLILIHELGHALLVWRRGHTVVGVEASGLGGVCQWDGNASPFDEALIAWGGVLAQLVLYVTTQLLLLFIYQPHTAFGWQVASAFTDSNLYLIAINLLPIPPLDGARAWRIFSAFRERGAKGVPYGTWRDHSVNAQDGWFKAGRKAKSKPSAKPPPPAPPEEAGTLSAKNQRALDDLLRGVTGKPRTGSDRDTQ